MQIKLSVPQLLSQQFVKPHFCIKLASTANTQLMLEHLLRTLTETSFQAARQKYCGCLIISVGYKEFSVEISTVLSYPK